jgi:hypothetical protein
MAEPEQGPKLEGARGGFPENLDSRVNAASAGPWLESGGFRIALSEVRWAGGWEDKVGVTIDEAGHYDLAVGFVNFRSAGLLEVVEAAAGPDLQDAVALDEHGAVQDDFELG